MVRIGNIESSVFYTLRVVLIFVIVVGCKKSGFSQIKISMGGDTLIHHSALLELESTDKGILIPRMDSVSRLGIQSPANGLLVYDTTYNDFYFYNGQNWNSLGQTSSQDFHVSINNPVCHGDSIKFEVISDDYNDFWWITPTNDTLHFEDTTFMVEPNTLTSGRYEANFVKNNLIYKKYQWVTIEECRIIVQDDIIMYNDSYKLYHITQNDHDNGNYKKITKINNQEVKPFSTIFVGEGFDVGIMVNDEENGIYINPQSNINKLVQFSYEVSDGSNYVDSGFVTLAIHKTPNYHQITRDSFNTLLSEASNGDTIDLQFNVINIAGFPLDIDKSITLKNGYIKRACTKEGTNSDTIFQGQNFIVMNEPFEFNIGEWILPVFGTSVDENSGGQILQITNIVEDTIFIYQTFENEIPPGSFVINIFPLVRVVHDSIACIFENLIFDGQKTCNNYTNDWKYNHILNIDSNDSIKNCVFINASNENIFMCGGGIRNSRAYKLNGSFIHASCSVTNPPASIIQDNYTNGVCLVSISENGHNEGWFTYSSNTKNFNVTDNFSENGGESCFGSQEMDDYNNIFTNNTFINFKNKKNYTEPGHPYPDNILNNTYINVPD